jgi:hypothetical protein
MHLVASLYNLDTDRVENTASNVYSIFARVSVAADTCLSSCYQAMAVIFSRHVALPHDFSQFNQYMP